MPNPYGVVGLTYDGTDLQPEDMQWFLEIEKGLDETPTVRGRDTIIPGRDGRFEQNRRNDVLPIILRGFVTCDPTLTDRQARRESFRDNMRTLRALFASNRTSATLLATLEDGTEESIAARPLNIVGGRVGSDSRLLSVELEGYDDWAPEAS